jgi:hypothetical protein
MSGTRYCTASPLYLRTFSSIPSMRRSAVTEPARELGGSKQACMPLTCPGRRSRRTGCLIRRSALCRRKRPPRRAQSGTAGDRSGRDGAANARSRPRRGSCWSGPSRAGQELPATALRALVRRSQSPMRTSGAVRRRILSHGVMQPGADASRQVDLVHAMQGGLSEVVGGNRVSAVQGPGRA